MNIAIVCYPTFGGSGIVATELGLQLAAQSHKVHFISYEQPVRLSMFNPNVYFHEVELYKYPLFEYSSPYESIMTSKIIEVVLKENIDLIHVHYAIPHAGVAYIVREILKSKGINLPYITTLHGTDITLIGKDKSFYPIVEFTINNSNAVTVISEFLKKETLKNFNITVPIHVIPNFVDTQKALKDISDPCNNFCKERSEKILVHVSNFRKVKRVEDIVNGFEIVSKRVNSKLFLVGDGPEKPSIEKLVVEKKLINSVRFLGRQYDVNKIFAVCDVFILASEQESFGLAALEAMSCGLPLVVTDAGGLPELNINYKTGFNFKVGDYNKMAELCIKLLSNTVLYDSMKTECFLQAKKFDVSKIISEYLSMYKKTLGNEN